MGREKRPGASGLVSVCSAEPCQNGFRWRFARLILMGCMRALHDQDPVSPSTVR